MLFSPHHGWGIITEKRYITTDHSSIQKSYKMHLHFLTGKRSKNLQIYISKRNKCRVLWIVKLDYTTAIRLSVASVAGDVADVTPVL